MNPIRHPREYFANYLTDRVPAFGIGQDTGLAEFVIEAGIGPPEGTTATTYLLVRVMLTPEAAQKLLADLPRIEAILAQAAKGPPKPDAVQ